MPKALWLLSSMYMYLYHISHYLLAAMHSSLSLCVQCILCHIMCIYSTLTVCAILTVTSFLFFNSNILTIHTLGLTGLRELSLDNTVITDEGIKYIAGTAVHVLVHNIFTSTYS